MIMQSVGGPEMSNIHHISVDTDCMILIPDTCNPQLFNSISGRAWRWLLLNLNIVVKYAEYVQIKKFIIILHGYLLSFLTTGTF